MNIMEETKKEELKISQGDLMVALQSVMPNLLAKALPDNKWIIQTDGHTLITFDDTLRHYKLASNFIKNVRETPQFIGVRDSTFFLR